MLQPPTRATNERGAPTLHNSLPPLPPPRRNKFLLAVTAAALLIWLLFLAYLAWAT